MPKSQHKDIWRADCSECYLRFLRILPYQRCVANVLRSKRLLTMNIPSRRSDCPSGFDSGQRIAQRDMGSMPGWYASGWQRAVVEESGAKNAALRLPQRNPPPALTSMPGNGYADAKGARSRNAKAPARAFLRPAKLRPQVSMPGIDMPAAQRRPPAHNQRTQPTQESPLPNAMLAWNGRARGRKSFGALHQMPCPGMDMRARTEIRTRHLARLRKTCPAWTWARGITPCRCTACWAAMACRAKPPAPAGSRRLPRMTLFT